MGLRALKSSGKCAGILGLSGTCLLVILCLLCILSLLIGLVLSGLALVSVRGSRIRTVLLVPALLSGSCVGTTILSSLSTTLATLRSSGIGSSIIGSTVGGSASIGISSIASLQRLKSVQESCQRVLV